VKIPHYLICITFLLPAVSVQAQVPGLVLSGELKNEDIITQDIDTVFHDQFDFTGSNILTLNFRNRDDERVKVEGSTDITLLYGQYADRLSFPAPVFSAQLGASSFLVDIRKLYGSLFLPFADFSIGRQIVNFGQGLVFSPIDVFSSINVLDISFKRTGSDVVRIKVPFGSLAGADVIAKLSSRARGETGAAKLYANLYGWDFAAVGMYKGDMSEVITGFTFKGDAFIGLYGELVEHWLDEDNRYFRGMAGADYSIQNTWFFNLEYLYNQRNPVKQSPLFINGTDLLFSRHHYLFGSVRYVFNELMWASLSALGDVEQRSGLFTAQYLYNVVQNADFSFYIRYIHGAFIPVPVLSIPDMQYGLIFRISF